MKITFVVPLLNLSGGLRVVSIYAELLDQLGHSVTVVSPNKKTPNFKEWIKSKLSWNGYKFKSGFDQSFFLNTKYDVKILDKFRPVTNEDVHDADVVIATFWNTVEWVQGFSKEKGKNFYFIQHYEIHPWLDIERVKATFRSDFKKIVVAKWLADILETEYQQKSVIINNAVDHQLFHSPVRDKNDITTFGVMYSQRAYKGSQLAFSCFNKIKEKFPRVRLLVFGLEDRDEVEELPSNTEYYCRPEQTSIRDIYSQCDAWLFTSSTEGFGLPILEAMACRTPVIGTNCGAAPELLESGGGILININDADALVSAMMKFLDMDNNVWRLMSEKAYKEGLAHCWGNKAKQLEEALRDD